MNRQKNRQGPLRSNISSPAPSYRNEHVPGEESPDPEPEEDDVDEAAGVQRSLPRRRRRANLLLALNHFNAALLFLSLNLK